MLGAQQQHRQQQQRDRGSSGELGLGRILEQAPDLGGHGVEAGGQREDRGRAEQRHRLQERDQRAGQHRGQRQRNGDAPRRHPHAAAENGGRVLEIARNAVERVRDQHEHVRERVAGDHEDQPAERIDVEQRLGAWIADGAAIELVEQPRVRRGEQFPGDRAEERRRDERGGHQRADGAAQRHVGARHQPAHRRCDHAADDGGRGRKDDGGDERVEEGRIGDKAGEVVERETARLVGQAEVGQPRHRQHDQHDQDRRKCDQDRPGEVEAGAALRGCGDGEGHCRASRAALFPSPACGRGCERPWGGARERVALRTEGATNFDPPPQPSPSSGEGAHRRSRQHSPSTNVRITP